MWGAALFSLTLPLFFEREFALLIVVLVLSSTPIFASLEKSILSDPSFDSWRSPISLFLFSLLCFLHQAGRYSSPSRILDSSFPSHLSSYTIQASLRAPPNDPGSKTTIGNLKS